MAIPFGKYTIKSYTGPYLSVDGSGLTMPRSGGAGTVSCSSDCKNKIMQQFFIIPVAENTNIYTIQPVAYPGVYNTLFFILSNSILQD